jgi:hypothetical protein
VGDPIHAKAFFHDGHGPILKMVIDYARVGSDLTRHRPAAMFDLGRSEWLRSCAPQHLERCRHYQLFYDELFDVIAEGLECRASAFVAA